MLFSHAIKKSNTLVLWRPNISVCQSKSSFYSWLCLGTENHTLFVSLGTTKGFGLITRVNPKPSQCTLLQKCKIDQAKNIDNLNADLTIFCNYCKDWKHIICAGVSLARFRILQRSENPFKCNKGKCARANNEPDSDESDID